MSPTPAIWNHNHTVRIGTKNYMDIRANYPDDENAFRHRDLALVGFIIVHHSGKCATDNPSSQIHTPLDVSAIYTHHVFTQQFGGIGYHAIIDHWGNTLITGSADEIRAGVQYKNTNSYHVCLLGNFNYYYPPPDQITATREFITNVRFGFGRRLAVLGHRDFAEPGDPTTCPGTTWPYWSILVDSDRPIEQPGIMAYREEMKRWLEATEKK